MPLTYTRDKADLGIIEPCFVCKKEIDVDGVVDGVPNCVICENGHRLHRTCFEERLRKLKTDKCYCGEGFKMCYTSEFGYGYIKTVGGKRKTVGGKRKTRTNKRKISKMNKKRKTYKRK